MVFEGGARLSGRLLGDIEFGELLGREFSGTGVLLLLLLLFPRDGEEPL